MIVLRCLVEPQKISFLIHMPPAWLDFGSQDGPNLGPKWYQNRSTNGIGSEVGSRADFEPIPDRFGVDFGPIFGSFWYDFWLLFWVMASEVLAQGLSFGPF